MPETRTITVYSFAELNDHAKERARHWYRQDLPFDPMDFMVDDWQTIATILGIDFDTDRITSCYSGKVTHRPKIYWRGFSSQGDGASWFGWYCYAKNAPRLIRAHAPQDKELHRIADQLQAVQRKYFYSLQATVTAGARSNFYSHSGTMSIDVTDKRDIDESDVDSIETLLRDFADWIYSQLESEWDYQNSDSVVDESIIAKEYMFDCEGNCI